MPKLFKPLSFARGPVLRNRFMLSPLTNQQSAADGRLSDDEFRWLVKRALGGFALTATSATSVQKAGIGFTGRLGAYDDDHISGLSRFAAALKSHGAHAVVQLHHAGIRSPKELILQQPQGPSGEPETGARAMTLAEISRVLTDFISAARRAEQAGFNGVGIHAAHGYLPCQFLSPESNRRDDHYGGSLENRSRLMFEIIDRVRESCRADFSIGVRLSAERHGLRLEEMRTVAQRLMREQRIDYLDLSLSNAFKEPNDEAFKGRTLLSCFTDLERGSVRLGAAGKILTGADVSRAMDAGLDFVIIGRAGILHHDFPKRVAADPAFADSAAGQRRVSFQ